MLQSYLKEIAKTMTFKLKLMMAAVCAAGFGLSACAGVAVGENILNNATLEFGDEGGPLDWNLSSA